LIYQRVRLCANRLWFDLDRLAQVKELAQLGATIGREFSYELLHAVSPVDEETLQQGLRQLVDAELLYQRGLPPQATYLFKHALIQDTAYQSLLKSTRQQYHRQIAQVLEEKFPETKETQPELVAHHYTEAGLVEQAIPYWQQAGQRASLRSANVEAISHLNQGLELLKSLPDTPERTQQELALQMALGAPLMATKGFGALEVEKAYTRARELYQQVGESPQLPIVLWGLWAFYLTRAEHKAARELGEQLLTLGQNGQDLAVLSQAHYALGATLFYLGEFAPARTQLEQGIALYAPQQRRPHAFLYGQDDARVTCLTIAALTLWLLGYPDQALEWNHEALTQAHHLSSPLRLAWTLNFSAMLSRYLREEEVAQERVEAMMTLSTEQEFPFYLASGTIYRGWALVGQGQGEEGITQIRQGIDTYRATGAELARPQLLALLAEAYGKVEEAAQGLAALVDALSQVEQTGERQWEAELYRLKGELTLQQLKIKNAKLKITETQDLTVSSQEAEGDFQKAIEIAQRQRAKSLELRATVSFARLWQQQGKQKEAHEMLAEIYGWFTEGFDTKDLQEAKALLKELA
jgi:predicted ATPase